MSEAITKMFEEIFGTKEKEFEKLGTKEKEFEKFGTKEKEFEKLGSLLTEKAITLALQELTQKEKENTETAGKYDPRSLSIARTKLEDAVLLLIDTKKNVSSLFKKVNARNEAEMMSLVLSAMRWIESSENPEKLRKKIDELTEKEINKGELGMLTISGLMKAVKF